MPAMRLKIDDWETQIELFFTVFKSVPDSSTWNEYAESF